MGLWLIDAGNCEELVQVCERLGRWEFMFNVAPLRFKNATGSPVKPLGYFLVPSRNQHSHSEVSHDNVFGNAARPNRHRDRGGQPPSAWATPSPPAS